jgi:hypothetical protein
MAKPKKPPPRKPAPRADYGKPIDGFLAKQPPALRAILDALKAVVDDVAPGAEASLKWGMPFYTLGGEMMLAMGAHKAHVNLILPGPPGTYADPDGLLEGEGKTGQHLKITSAGELPRAQVRRWIEAAARRATRS